MSGPGRSPARSGARGCIDMRLRRVGAINHNAPALRNGTQWGRPVSVVPHRSNNIR
ncbi:hypothetical protein GCM10009566_29740 [Streptomyces murinus]